jgi:hypothetical protein
MHAVRGIRLSQAAEKRSLDAGRLDGGSGEEAAFLHPSSRILHPACRASAGFATTQR